MLRLSRIAGVLACAISLVLPVRPASGQTCFTGAFSAVDFSRTGQNGLALVAGINPDQIRLDRLADGDNLLTTDDPVFDLPFEARGAVNFAASPSLDFVLCYPCPNLSPCTAAAGQQSATICVLRRPSAGSVMEVVHTDCLAAGVLNGTAVWYDAGACLQNLFTGACTVTATQQPGQIPCNRVLMIRTLPQTGIDQQLRIYNLNDTTPSALDGQAIFNAGRSIQDTTLRINRNGDYLLIQHDLAPVQPTTSTWDIVDLCPGSASFGQAVHRVTSGMPAGTSVSASIAGCTTDETTISLSVNTLPAGSVSFPRCCAPSPPPSPTGRCCIAGGCTVTTLAGCAAGVAGWTQGQSCATACPPPPPILTIALSGPGSVISGDVLDYTIVVGNAGAGSAESVTVRQTLPTGATFVAAPGASTVGTTSTWSLPSLAAGASQTFVYSVRPNCVASPTQLLNPSGSTSASASNYPMIFPPAVTTTVQPRPVVPVALAVSASPQRTPLRGGDTVDYTITLNNSTGPMLSGLSISSVRPGEQATWQSVVSAGGGTIVIAAGGSSCTWTGSLAAGSTASIVIRAVINTCISESASATRLNSGSTISLRDSCSATLGSSAPPPATPLVRPIGATLRAVNVTSGLIGPAASGGVFGSRLYQPIRDGAPLELEVEIRNTLPENVPDGFFEFVVPANLAVSDPPFVPPVPSGATWDAATRRIGFAGAVPGNSSVFIRFLGTPTNPPGQCHLLLEADAGTAACRNAPAAVDLLFVPALPTQPHLQFADGFRGLFLFTPGVDTAKRDLLCLVGEIYTDMDRDARNGDLYVIGLPNFVFNPETLDFAFFDAELRSAAGGTSFLPRAVAVDPIDGTLLISSNSSNHLRRFDRHAGTFTTIINEASVGSAADIFVKPDGTVIIAHGNAGALSRFDGRTGPFPISPASLTPIPIVPPDYADASLVSGRSNQGTHLFRAPNGNAGFVLASDFLTGNLLRTAYAYYDLDTANYTGTLVHRAVAASAFNLSTGFPSLPPNIPGLLLPADIRNSAVARSPDRLYLLPVGQQNTNLIGLDFMPPGIAVNVLHAPFSASAAEFVDPSAAPICAADFNLDGALDPDDLGDFINCFFASPPCTTADFNGDAIADADDLADYINAYFAGCP